MTYRAYVVAGDSIIAMDAGKKMRLTEAQFNKRKTFIQGWRQAKPAKHAGAIVYEVTTALVTYWKPEERIEFEGEVPRHLLRYLRADGSKESLAEKRLAEKAAVKTASAKRKPKKRRASKPKAAKASSGDAADAAAAADASAGDAGGAASADDVGGDAVQPELPS